MFAIYKYLYRTLILPFVVAVEFDRGLVHLQYGEHCKIMNRNKNIDQTVLNFKPWTGIVAIHPLYKTV